MSGMGIKWNLVTLDHWLLKKGYAVASNWDCVL
nr:MAG TPA: hypothetical protein [Caudoviricetes sp.]